MERGKFPLYVRPDHHQNQPKESNANKGQRSDGSHNSTPKIMQFCGDEFHSLDNLCHAPNKDEPWNAGCVAKQAPCAIEWIHPLRLAPLMLDPGHPGRTVVIMLICSSVR